MTIADNAAHRSRWIADVARITREIQDLQHEVDVAVIAATTHQAMHLLAEADAHLELSIKELDEAHTRIVRI